MPAWCGGGGGERGTMQELDGTSSHICYLMMEDGMMMEGDTGHRHTIPV